MTSLIKTKPQSIQSKSHFQFFGPSSLLKDAEQSLLSPESVCISLLQITQMVQQSFVFFFTCTNICTHDKNPKHQQPLHCWHTRKYSTHRVKPSRQCSCLSGRGTENSHMCNLSPQKTCAICLPKKHVQSVSQTCAICLPKKHVQSLSPTCAICLPNMCNLSPKHVQSVSHTCAICLPNMCNLSPRKHVD